LESDDGATFAVKCAEALTDSSMLRMPQGQPEVFHRFQAFVPLNMTTQQRPLPINVVKGTTIVVNVNYNRIEIIFTNNIHE
jgi:hypothetical protein